MLRKKTNRTTFPRGAFRVLATNKEIHGRLRGMAGKVRQWSAQFDKFPKVLQSGVSVRLLQETKYLVNTEGTRLQHGRSFARIVVTAHAKAEDGMDLSTSDSFEAEERPAAKERK